jgi:hypothetical protein
MMYALANIVQSHKIVILWGHIQATSHPRKPFCLYIVRKIGDAPFFSGKIYVELPYFVYTFHGG